MRILPLLMLLAACSDTAGPGARSVRVSAQVNPAAPPSENVTVTIENRGSEPLLVPRCSQRIMLSVERRAGGEWEEYSGDVCLFLDLSIPLELAPGATATTSRSVPDAGRYRIRLRAWPKNDTESERTALSSEFNVP
jgi:hypothetical protein